MWCEMWLFHLQRRITERFLCFIQNRFNGNFKFAEAFSMAFNVMWYDDKPSGKPFCQIWFSSLASSLIFRLSFIYLCIDYTYSYYGTTMTWLVRLIFVFFPSLFWLLSFEIPFAFSFFASKQFAMANRSWYLTRTVTVCIAQTKHSKYVRLMFCLRAIARIFKSHLTSPIKCSAS